MKDRGKDPGRRRPSAKAPKRARSAAEQRRARQRAILAKLAAEGEVWFTDQGHRWRVRASLPVNTVSWRYDAGPDPTIPPREGHPYGHLLALVQGRLCITYEVDKSTSGGFLPLVAPDGNWSRVPYKHLFGEVLERHPRPVLGRAGARVG